MILTRHVPRIALVFALLTVPLGLARAEGPAAPKSSPDLYSRALRSTTLILTPTGSGTGWVLDREERLLVTNEHVVGAHEQVVVVFPVYDRDGRPVVERARYGRQAPRLEAEVVDAEAGRDLALVRLREPVPEGVAAVRLAGREPRPGERVHSLGNPDASDALWVYSSGRVRQVYHKAWRYGPGPVRSARVVETQSAINPGDSGGPVFDDAGDLVGVVSGRKPDASLMGWCIAAAEVRDYLAEVRPLVQPRTADAYRRRGLRALARGLAARALDDLNEACRLDPASADALVARAEAHRARGDYELALADCGEALERNPRHAGALDVRGCLCSDRGRFDEALRDFCRAARLAPTSGRIHANRGFAHAGKGELDQAVRCYDEALRLEPGVAEWHYLRGLARERQGDTPRAEEDYARAVRLDPAYQERVVRQALRQVQVANRSGQKVQVHLRYETRTEDGRWTWLPAQGALSWEVPAGATGPLLVDGRPVLARRLRIWAEGLETTAVWHAVKDSDTWAAPAAGYRGGSRPDVYTYTFNR